jgi:hypothetical protein
MPHVQRVAVITKTGGEPPQNAGATFHFAQQQSTTVRAQLSAVEPGHHFPPSHRLETELFDRTLCLHLAAAPVLLMLLLTLNLIARDGGVLLHRVRNAG